MAGHEPDRKRGDILVGEEGSRPREQITLHLSTAIGFSPLAVMISPRGRPLVLPRAVMGFPMNLHPVSDFTPFLVVASASRMESPAVTMTWAWCINRSTRAEARLVDQLIERRGVQVGRHCQGTLFVTGVDQAVEALSGIGADRQQTDVVNHDQVRSDDRASALAMLSSTRCRRMRAPRSSIENQTTVCPWSMAC